MISEEEFAERFAEVYQTAQKRDRGSIKWTAMMLPEHTMQLREDVANYNKIERPILDNYDLEYIQDEIQRAVASKSEVRIKMWIDGEFKFQTGTIEEINLVKKYIEIDGPLISARLNLNEIVGIQLEG